MWVSYLKTNIILQESILTRELLNNRVTKLYIVGSVGSGKTTLGKSLAEKLDLSFYEMDNLIFERLGKGDRKRSDEEINKLVNGVIKENHWLIEGTCLREIVQPIFDESERIIFLDVPYTTRVSRFSLRYIKQKLAIEEANYHPTFAIYKQMFKWNHQFEKKGYQEFLDRTINYPEKRICYKS